VKSLNRSCCETDVVQSVSSKLVSELDLRHANIIRVDEAQTGWCDAAVFVMWVGRGCSFEHGQGRGMELLGSIFLFLFTFFCQDLVLAIDHVCVLRMLILDGECVRKLTCDRVAVNTNASPALGPVNSIKIEMQSFCLLV
jgi:hypothetical protein